jgi:hypothetical protein
MFAKHPNKSLVVWLIALVIIAGCQPGSPTDPLSPPSSEQVATPHIETRQTPTIGDEDSGGLLDLFIIRDLLNGVTRTVTGLVTPLLGGTLHLSQSQLVVHPLAVLLPTMVRFSMTTTAPENLPGALNRVYDFSPDGLTFHVPTTLYVSFSDAGLGHQDPTRYTFYYFNENQNRWEPQATVVDMQNHQFIVTLHHFSRYAFGR